MLAPHDNRLGISKSPHSLANIHSLTIPSWGDSNYFVQTQKAWNGAGMAGLGCSKTGCSGGCCGGGMAGVRGLSFDGTGLLGTGLFSGDISSWGISELVFGLMGAYAVYAMFFQAKQTKYRMEISAGRRRKRKASSLRDKAKRLEEQTTGIF